MLNRYYSTNAEDGAEIKVSLAYSLGGINYWNYETDPRGYYVSVARVVREKTEHFAVEKFTLGEGFRVFVKEVTRKSKKAEAEAEAIAESKADEFAARLAERLGLTIEAVVA